MTYILRHAGWPCFIDDVPPELRKDEGCFLVSYFDTKDGYGDIKFGDYALDNTKFLDMFADMASEHNHIPSGNNPKGDLTLIQIAQRFSTEEAAREYFEKLRWPDGPVCPPCGNANQDRVYKLTPNPKKKIRAGLYKCAD